MYLVQCYKRYMTKTNWTQLVDKYLTSKKLAWSESAQHSESYRLRKTLPALDGNADTLWESLGEYAPYTRVTIWTRVSAFYDWCIQKGHLTGPNPYAAFREENARQFKGAYVRRKPEMTFEEAHRLVDTIPNPAVRKQALEILLSGLRYQESCTHKDGYVTGKGNKTRRVYVPAVEGPSEKVSYKLFLKTLKEHTGLKPHDLRKLFLTRLVDKGGNVFQLQEVAGWASLNTASSYIQVNQEKTRKLVEEIQGVDNDFTGTQKQVS